MTNTRKNGCPNRGLRSGVILIALLCFASTAVPGCEESDLGRYCVLGTEMPFCSQYCCEQPTLTALNLEAPECESRICLQQGPYKLHQIHIDDPTVPCNEDTCPAPYRCDPDAFDKCIYRVKPVCSRECKKHADCRRGQQDANGKVCTRYVCHKQPSGEAFAHHCICVCRDFLINPTADPPRFYSQDETPDEPEACR